MGKSRRQKQRKPPPPINVTSPSAHRDSDDGSLKIKFILSPKTEEEDDDSLEEIKQEYDEEEEESFHVISPVKSKGKSKHGSKGDSSKQKVVLKGKTSLKSSREKARPTSKLAKRKAPSGRSDQDDECSSGATSSKKTKTSLESVEKYDGKVTVKGIKKEVMDESQSAAGSKKVWELLSGKHGAPVPVAPVQPVEKRKEKKKKKKEKEKKKKLFSSKSDKNRFLNVRRFSDEDGDGWIPEKQLEKSTEYEVIATWEKPYEKIHVPHKEISIEMESESKDGWKEKKLKSKYKSKSNKRRKHEKKMRKMMQLHQKRQDKETLTREQIIKIQQKLMSQGMKSPTNFGKDLELNFSSHGEDLILQLTSSSENFDPSSLLMESSAEESTERHHSQKKEIKKTEKSRGDIKEGKNDQKRKPNISAYMLWCKSSRAKIVREHPGIKFAEISKKLGERWQALPEKEKSKWRNQRRTLMMKHKNVPSLSRLKRQAKNSSGKVKKQIKVPPPHTDPIDVAAHLKLLGDSLANVGQSLMSHAGGQTEVHGSMSVLLDSMLSAMAPLICLTSQVEETNVIPKKTQVGMLENISYIMPGL